MVCISTLNLIPLVLLDDTQQTQEEKELGLGSIGNLHHL